MSAVEKYSLISVEDYLEGELNSPVKHEYAAGDQGEKKDAYLTIPSLSVYLLIEQDKPKVIVFRRTADGFVPESYEGLESVIPLSEIETELPLAEIFEAVEFIPEKDDQDT